MQLNSRLDRFQQKGIKMLKKRHRRKKNNLNLARTKKVSITGLISILKATFANVWNM